MQKELSYGVIRLWLYSVIVIQYINVITTQRQNEITR